MQLHSGEDVLKEVCTKHEITFPKPFHQFFTFVLLKLALNKLYIPAVKVQKDLVVPPDSAG